jgi:hypothetical protein
LVVPTDWPAPHQWPAGQGLWLLTVDTAVAQKKPAKHWFVRSEVLPRARQLPAVHGFTLPTLCPAPHQKPAGH